MADRLDPAATEGVGAGAADRLGPCPLAVADRPWPKMEKSCCADRDDTAGLGVRREATCAAVGGAATGAPWAALFSAASN